MLARLVNVMVSLELRFVQERAEDGQLVYKLDPWVLELWPRKNTGADARPQAGGLIRDIRWQACSRYPSAALRRAAPRCYRGQFMLALSQSGGMRRVRFRSLLAPHRRLMLRLPSATRRPSSERKRRNPRHSSAAQERPEMQMRTSLRGRRARGCSRLHPPRTSHRGNEIKPWLPMWTPQKSLLWTSLDDR